MPFVKQQRNDPVVTVPSDRCKCCSLADCSQVPLGCYGNPRGTALVILGHPSGHDDFMGAPHYGPSYTFLDGVLEETGLNLRCTDVPYTFAAKCCPNRKGHSVHVSEVDTCSSMYLRVELQIFRPDVILCWGKTAYRGLYTAASETIPGLIEPSKYDYQWIQGLDVPTCTGRPLCVFGMFGPECATYGTYTREEFLAALYDIRNCLDAGDSNK